MKTVIRQNTFETNSSSTHSLVLIVESTYNEWKEGKKWALFGLDWSEAPVMIDPILTEEDLTNFFKNYPDVYPSFKEYVGYVMKGNTTLLGLFNKYIEDSVKARIRMLDECGFMDEDEDEDFVDIEYPEIYIAKTPDDWAWCLEGNLTSDCYAMTPVGSENSVMCFCKYGYEY